jgi:hypothetical protein
MTTSVTIPGGGSSVIVFTVSGTQGATYASAAANYATDFQSRHGAVTDISKGGTESTTAGAGNLISGTNTTTPYTLSTGAQYTFVDAGGPVTINGSAAGGDSVLGGGDLTYNAVGNGNNVVFTDGTNVYQGGTASGDTISGGTGYDTINTGTGSDTVFSGSGHDLIILNDTVGGDVVNMEQGNTTINAFGVSDTVFAASTGTIFGGTGSLTFVAETTAPSNVTINGGTGTTTMFGADGTNLVFSNAPGAGSAAFIAGTGNETLNGANAAGGFAFFGDADTTATINDSVVGGSGTDYFSTGAGNESLFGGSGTGLFEINTIMGSNAVITISDFGGADSVNFGGMSVSDETSMLGTASSTSGGNLTVSLSDGTKVEFVGVTSLSGHLY